jgi:hypothetical protein
LLLQPIVPFLMMMIPTTTVMPLLVWPAALLLCSSWTTTTTTAFSIQTIRDEYHLVGRPAAARSAGRTPAGDFVMMPDGERRRRRSSRNGRLLLANRNNNNEQKPTDDPPPEEEKTGGGFWDFLSPYESKIPKSIEAEIYAAEAKTPAARDRDSRVALYTSVAVLGIMAAFFNGFLSELRISPDIDGHILTLDEAGFGWVVNNPLFSFLFTNKIGGGLCLVLGGGSGLLAEAELDTKRLNAEKIYEELVRRRTAREAKANGATTTSRPIKKKRRNKTLEALAEVLRDDVTSKAASASRTSTATSTATVPNEAPALSNAPSTLAKKEDETPQPSSSSSSVGGNNNLLDKMKELYQKADTMAATQALLLNKQLEDQGILEKITDESGLKVIGKTATAAAKKNKNDEDKVESSK